MDEKFLEVLEQNPYLDHAELAKAVGCSINMIYSKMQQLRDLPERIEREQEYLIELQDLQLRAEEVLQKRKRKLP